jgi:rubrerythrin
VSTREEVIPLFRKLLKLEKEAEDMYNEFLSKIKDPELVKDLTFIRNQEITHVKLAKKSLEILGETV